MTATASTESIRLTDHADSRSDALLLDTARAGCPDAFAALWSRHSGAGRALAWRHTRTFDADDLVAEAYVLILQTIRNGKGPRTEFRPYLFATIKNVAASWSAKGQRMPSTTIDELYSVDADDGRIDLADKLAIQHALSSLPERWQQVLWYSEVKLGYTSRSQLAVWAATRVVGPAAPGS